MSTTKQALREEFQCMQEHYSDPADRKRQVIYIAAEALLDELEGEAGRIKELESQRQLAFMANNRWSEKFREAENRNAEQATIIAKQEKWIKDVEVTMIAATDRAEAAEKRIAELEAREIREEGNQFLVVRHPGKAPVIKHFVGELDAYLLELNALDPLVTIDIITYRYYGVGGQWVQDADEYLAAAGITVKGG